MNDTDIDFKTFNWFIYKFSIYPEILPKVQDIATIYRSVFRKKDTVDNKPIGMRFHI